jgi:hypothetical protein
MKEPVPWYIIDPPSLIEIVNWVSNMFTVEILLFLILIVLVIAYLPKLVSTAFKILMWGCIAIGSLVLFMLIYENLEGVW